MTKRNFQPTEIDHIVQSKLKKVKLGQKRSKLEYNNNCDGGKDDVDHVGKRLAIPQVVLSQTCPGRGIAIVVRPLCSKSMS